MRDLYGLKGLSDGPEALPGLGLPIERRGSGLAGVLERKSGQEHQVVF